MNRSNVRRSLLPLTLIVLGFWLISGCIYVPMFGRTLRGNNAAKQVGDEKSSRPVQINRSTRDQVVSVLGRPYAQLPDGTALAYTWRVQNGVAIWPICFYADSIESQRTLVLRFDTQGVLRSFQVLKGYASGSLTIHRDMSVPLPPDLQATLGPDAPHPGVPSPSPTHSPPGTPYRTDPGP